ncbi:MAG: hypothetical protein JNL11_04000 [Bdellovibrionaceae bacterium]|nr:hypothetical protein [Pseudobdellovibrionaceae bacterium]
MRVTHFLLSSLFAISTLFLGCESKFAESSPDSVKISGLPLEERVQQKAKVDSRIDDIQTAADRTKKIIDMFRKIQDPTNHSEVYTPIDFLIDLNDELKSQIPENEENEKLARRGKIILPFTNLSDACRSVETLLESDVQKETAAGIDTTISDRLVYQLKTCASEGKYLPTIIAMWEGPSVEFRVENKNLESLFGSILQSENLKTSVCRFKKSDKKIIDTFSCENMELRLSNSEAAYIKTMAFDNNGDIRFEATADIFENRNKKAQSFIRAMSNGEVKFQMNKIGADGQIVTRSEQQK